MTRRSKPPTEPAGATWLRYSHLGIQFGLTILLLTLAGQWADQRLDTEPWLLVTGSLLGVTGGIYHIVRATTPRSPPPPS